MQSQPLSTKPKSPTAIVRLLILLVAIIALAWAAVTLSGKHIISDPKPSVTTGIGYTYKGVLSQDSRGEFYLADATAAGMNVFVLNGLDPKVKPSLTTLLGNQVTLFGETLSADASPTALYALWVNGKSLLSEEDILKTYRPAGFSAVFNSLSAEAQTCLGTKVADKDLAAWKTDTAATLTKDQQAALAQCATVIVSTPAPTVLVNSAPPKPEKE